MSDAMRPIPAPVLWAKPLEDWTAHLRARHTPSTTIKTRLSHMKHLARHHARRSPWSLTGEDLVLWFARQEWARETRRANRSTLRAFYGWAVASGFVAVSPALSLPAPTPAQARPRPAPDAVIKRAVDVADPRGRLILRLAAELGLRRAEIAVIHSRDLLSDGDGFSLVVHGKGDRERVLPVPDSLVSELRSLPAGYAFPGRDGGHLSPRYVGRIAADVLPGDWTLHTLRHRFGTRAYAIEHDLLVVQQLLGHTSPVTTRIYCQVPNERLRATVNAMHGAA